MTSKSPVWHPLTQHGVMGEPIAVERGEGVYLYTKDGKKLIDGISSWWVNTHGHCHPTIVEAVRKQAGQLEQVIFAGFTHEPAEQLTRKLLATVRKSLGPWLEYMFYSDSGSTAVEVALKMAIGYHKQAGSPRRTIVALDGGYHGETFGAMAASSRNVYNAMYEPYLFDVIHLPFPFAGREQETIEAYQNALKQNEDDIAAFIFEPLIQGAEGMRMYAPEVLSELSKISKRNGVLMIADEVMTGFGRTGTMFACEQAGIVPDLMCLSKGLTGGFLPMGATLCSEEIYDAFYSTDKARQFMHSTSFTGNPISCAAAIGSLQVWEDEPVLENIKAIEAAHKKAADWFGARPDVAEARCMGAVFALDIAVDKTDGVYFSDISGRLQKMFFKRGVLLRPIGNIVYILPPYCITAEELEHIYDALWQCLDELRDGSSVKAA